MVLCTGVCILFCSCVLIVMFIWGFVCFCLLWWFFPDCVYCWYLKGLCFLCIGLLFGFCLVDISLTIYVFCDWFLFCYIVGFCFKLLCSAFRLVCFYIEFCFLVFSVCVWIWFDWLTGLVLMSWNLFDFDFDLLVYYVAYVCCVLKFTIACFVLCLGWLTCVELFVLLVLLIAIVVYIGITR